MKLVKAIMLLLQVMIVCIYAQNIGDIVKVRDDLEILRISNNTYVHISKLVLNNGSSVLCNGMICISGNDCFIMDTPVTDEQSKSLIDYLTNKMKLNIKGVIACHFHEDCMGGINEFHKHNIPSYAYKMTKEIAEEKGLPLPQNVFDDSLIVKFGKEEVIAKYFGGGHTNDNIVVWFPKEKTLFGGCLIKAMKWNGLGNLADANINEWEGTVQKVKESFPDAETVIPGHDEFGGTELLDHTIELVRNYKRQNKH